MQLGKLLIALIISGNASICYGQSDGTENKRPACRVDSGLITPLRSIRDREPLLVLYQRNPWLMSVGSDFPSVAVYENGQVLYVKVDGKQAKVMSGQIGAPAAASLRDEIIASGFLDVADRTTCSNWTDQVTVQILLRKNESWKVASAYGIGNDGKCSVVPPKAFVEAYSRLQNIRAVNSVEFEPEEIEVAIWDFDHARGKPLPWPHEVPAPPPNIVPEYYSPYSPKPYKHLLSARFRPEIDELVRKMDSTEPSTAMLLNGHKWSVNPRWLWPGSRAVESAVSCSYIASPGLQDSE